MSNPERPEGDPTGPTDAEAEAVWNDLVAAFHDSRPPEGPAPWPEAENVAQPPAPGTLEPGARVVRPAVRPSPPRTVDPRLTWTSGDLIGPRDTPAPEPSPDTFEPPTPPPLPQPGLAHPGRLDRRARRPRLPDGGHHLQLADPRLGRRGLRAGRPVRLRLPGEQAQAAPRRR